MQTKQTQQNKPLRYKASRPQQQSSYSRLLGILIGDTGVGKTTLLNKICGTDHKAGANESSVTKNLYISTTNVGSNSFELIDTPGVDSQEETYKHAVLLRAALTARPINTIFIIVQYESRFQKIVNHFENVRNIVRKYDSKIVCMISHWDMSTDPQAESLKICKLLHGLCSNVIMYSKQHSSDDIADMMYDSLSSMSQTQLTFDDEEFFQDFNIFKIKFDMNKSYKEYETTLKKTVLEFDKIAISESEMNQEEKDDFLHCLIIAFKDEVEGLVTQFQQKHASEMIAMDYYAFHIFLQKDAVEVINSFSAKVSRLMSYSFNDNQDPRNLIKRCPNCSLIWWKTEGCDGQTTCGNMVSSGWDVLTRPWRRFRFARGPNGAFRWSRTEMRPVTASKVSRNLTGKRVGCNTAFVWGDLPPLGESVILELFQVKTMDEVKELIKSNSFQKARKAYEASIDTNFITSKNDLKRKATTSMLDNFNNSKDGSDQILTKKVKLEFDDQEADLIVYDNLFTKP